MLGVTKWNFAPYHPCKYDGSDIFICHVVPAETSIFIEWFYENGSDGVTIVYLRKRGQNAYECFGAEGDSFLFENLEPETDYEFKIRSGDHFSCKRLARTGRPIGNVVNYLHPDDEVYGYVGHTLGSPSLVRLPSGALLSSMDVYSNGCPQNLSIVFRSDDKGATWRYVTELMPCYWGKLFLHKGTLYMIGCSNEYGDILIGKSADEGKTWTGPSVLFRGSCNSFFPGFLSCPTPVVTCGGRIWKAVDYGDRRAYDPRKSVPHMHAVISADESADLLDPRSWHLSEPLPYNPDWPGTARAKEGFVCQGGLESNAVVGPDGELWVIPRYHTYNCDPDYGKLVLYKADKNDPDRMIDFYKVADFNGNTSKFEIIRDGITGYYLCVLNGLDERNRSLISSRDLMMLYKSSDLEHWDYVCTITDLVGREGEGSQNASVVIDGDDLIMTCRTAINNPIGPMFANYQTFHLVENFRNLL
ncbi:MAG: exo-alpha-sialidase [Clostridia bacterium]|nr:exo-alpha-sialidase [Clostridia bacterium]